MALSFVPSREEFEQFLDLQLGLVGVRLGDFFAEMQTIYPRIEKQFARTRNKYYRDESGPILRVGHNSQYTVFLYWLARAAFEAGRRSAADRVYALLRMVSSVDLYYEVELPDLWACDHPLGAVIGRGEFSRQSTLYFSQNCNIGNNRGVYPRISGNLLMMPNSSLLGDTIVTRNVVLSNGAYVVDAGELSDCVVFGRSPSLTFKPLEDRRFREISILEPI
jgi:serine O-acetyltransferase